MKKYLLPVVLFIVLSCVAFADDAADLKALQPLTTEEQSRYEEIKTMAPELHRFIVTRMYMRTVNHIIKKYNLNEDLSKLGLADFDKFPTVPEDASIGYCVSLQEKLNLTLLRQYRSGPSSVDDAADLKKLQPLTPEEQSKYEEIKSNALALHKFIVTRMYMRTIQQIFKKYNLNEDISKLGQADLDKFPPVPDDATIAYCISAKEKGILIDLRLYLFSGSLIDEKR